MIKDPLVKGHVCIMFGVHITLKGHRCKIFRFSSSILIKIIKFISYIGFVVKLYISYMFHNHSVKRKEYDLEL